MTDVSSPVEPNSDVSGLDRAAQLRRKMVDDLLAEGTITSRPVEAAMRKVRREAFAPGVELEEAYQLYNGVVTKRDDAGSSVSSVSAPQVQAYMLEQAAITPGMRILEIGSGGYNAALIAELVGPAGQVTTVDIDKDVIDRARHLLAQVGYPQVNVVLADAEFGVPEHAPYDRILVTVGAWDVPPAWVAQLAEGGRLAVPLQLRGLSRVITFERANEYLLSRASRLFGFVPIQGAGAHQTTLLVLREGEITLRFEEGPPTDPGLLEGVFDAPRVEVWSGVTIGRFEPWAGTQMWLATVLPGFCRVVLDRKLDTGLLSPPGSHSAAVAVVDDDTLAYVTTRGAADSVDVELGVHAFGPGASELAEQVAEQLQVWGREHRHSSPQFRVDPAGTADDQLPAGRVIDKKHSRITISWPGAASVAAGRGAASRRAGG
ncbi:protein-L-isoaspartate carboxylmethyltransferase [Frankia casuarinae]|uniref:Protein-L-isoaspartate O-methyltransferase n=1 Tax=Frankia casuarinae (strain DSM 45818 / CECT 9043 / HFP020203 / CcI3) TaxID=106370 RepID=Q2J7R9_FRACC|nr:methyltransferase, FxLD system [Frankia casuarinae]ABD12673.1 protein-L-isoaspartate(D-aspartate) O-methyltransferase [Frankia casuarinae]EYT91113.1 protein-L-isoaspartate carboxylmethyltransferase [Frankia casuarinae]